MDKLPFAVITGANTGIGFQTAHKLAGQNRHHIILACRCQKRAERAIEDLTRAHPTSSLEFQSLDLSDLSSVRHFANRLLARPGCELKLLVNNAGLNDFGGRLTGDGFEGIFQVNFLGHFHLMQLLLPLLERSAPARVVNVSSVMHRFVTTPGTDWAHVARTPLPGSYRYSKLAQILFTFECQRRFAGRGVTSVAVSPGAVRSDIWRSMSAPVRLLAYPVMQCLFLTPKQGSATSVHAASVALSPPGQLLYLSPYNVHECCSLLTASVGLFAGAQATKPSVLCFDVREARRLWEASEALLLGVR